MCINERSQIALSLEFNISCKYMRPLSFCVGIFTALKLFKFNTKIKKSKQACCKVFALLLFIYLYTLTYKFSLVLLLFWQYRV